MTDVSKLTPSERILLAAVVEHGGVTRAARVLGFGEKSTGARMAVVRQKIGATTTKQAIEMMKEPRNAHPLAISVALAAVAAPATENHEPTASQRAACLFAKTQADASGRPQSEVNAIVRESLINMAAKDVTPGAEKEEDQ